MTASNPFAGSSLGGHSGFKIPQPHYTNTKPSAPVHHDHNIIHNLVEDTVSTVAGIPMGMYQIGRSVVDAGLHHNVHPLEDMGKGLVSQYTHMYGPLFHGHVMETLHRMGQHPLQPILDAATLPTLGGSLVGRGASVIDAVGRAGLDAETAGRLTKALEPFKYHTAKNIAKAHGAEGYNPLRKTVSAIKGEPDVWRYYHGNPFIRARQHMFEAAFRKVTSLRHDAAGNPLSSDAIYQAKFIKKIRADKNAATGAMLGREMGAGKMLKDPNFTASDVAHVLAPHIHQMAVDHAMTISETKLAENGGQLAPGWAFLSKPSAKSFAKMGIPKSKEAADMIPWLKDHIRAGLDAQRKRDALSFMDHTGERQYLLHHTGSMKDYLESGGKNYAAIKYLWDKPTRFWKWLLLAVSPRHFVNLTAGNGLILGMSANPLATARSVFNVMSTHMGATKAARTMDDAAKAGMKISGKTVYDKWLTGAYQGFASDAMRDIKLVGKVGTKRHGAAKVVQRGLLGITYHVADTTMRKLGSDTEIRRLADYQGYRAGGLSHGAAADRALANPSNRYQVINNVERNLGQYHSYSRVEQAIKRVVPFYGWDRHLMRHVSTMVKERPAQAAALADIGQHGEKDTLKQLGRIPEFMQTLLPIHGHHGGILGDLLGHEIPGRGKAVDTRGLNPYNTAGDVLATIASLVHGSPHSGSELASVANPILTGAIEHYTGQSLLSGKHIPQKGGLIQDIVSNVGQTLPEYKIIHAATEGRPKPKINKRTGKQSGQLLYRGDLRQQVSSMMGLALRDYSKKRTVELADTEEGIKAPKKTGTTKFFKFPKSGSSNTSGVRVRRAHAPSKHPRLHTTPHNVLPKINF